MAINLKEFVRESVKTYLTIIKATVATKTELSAKNATNLSLVAYAKPTTAAAIAAADTIQTAIGKLEKGIDSAAANDHTHGNKAILDAITAAFTTALLAKLNGVADGANNYVPPVGMVVDGAYVHTDNNYATIDKNKVANLPANANTTFALATDLADIQALLSTDDTTLDELQEVVNYIKANRTTLQSLNLDNIAETATRKHFTAAVQSSLAFTAISGTEAQTDWNGA